MGYEALQQHTRLDLARRVKTLTLDVTEWTDAPRTGAMGLAESQRAALVEMMKGIDQRQQTAFAQIDQDIAGLSVAGWAAPDGSNPLDYWTITRGTTAKALRAVYEVPASKNFVVGDIRIGNRPIDFGAQIADFITIKLTGVATRIGQSTVAPTNGCVQAVGFAAPTRPRSVVQVLEEQAFSLAR